MSGLPPTRQKASNSPHGHCPKMYSLNIIINIKKIIDQSHLGNK